VGSGASCSSPHREAIVGRSVTATATLTLSEKATARESALNSAPAIPST
jgi:hypothetical protein